MSFGERLKNRRHELGLRVDDLASKIGKNRATIYRYEKSDIEAPSYPTLIELAEALMTTPEYLLGLDNEDHPPVPTRMKRTISIYGTIPAGTPYEAIEDIIGEVQIPDYLPSEEKLFALKIDGDSMNMVIPDGYIGVFEKTSELYSGQIGAVYVNGYDATVKKFHNLTDTIVLEPLSYNKEHTPVVIKKDDTDNPVVVLGKLVWACASDDYDFR